MKLSLCIATHNEEKFIHYPLDSAYDLVDEVIVVDGGSTDRTTEVARSYGDKVKIHKAEHITMFHINKQKAIENAKGEWILQLDADEALSKELKEEIKSVVSNEPEPNTDHRLPKTVAYWIPRKNFFLTRFLMKGGQYPDYTIRLYKNGFARFPCKSVHENVEILLTSEVDIRPTTSIGYLKSPIEHYADPTFSRYLARWNRYTSMDAQLLWEKSKISFIDYFFIKPIVWFFSTYFRHLGFMDGFPGLVFCLFSSLRFWAVYVKWWQFKHQS